MNSVITVTIQTANDITQLSVRISQKVAHAPRFDDIQDWLAIDRISHDAVTAYQNALREHAELHPKEHAALVRTA